MDNSARETPNQSDSERFSRSLRQRVWTVGLLFLSFLAYSFVRTPIPAVNEPHYLTKAKHFWNPDWGRGDLFLESSNPHYVFYSVVGSLTQWCSLEKTAGISRVAALLLLAMGFESLLSLVLRGVRPIVGAVWVYLGLAAVGNLSGEWIIGGVEGKVFAYGFAFWGAGLAVRGQFLPLSGVIGLRSQLSPHRGNLVRVCDFYGAYRSPILGESRG